MSLFNIFKKKEEKKKVFVPNNLSKVLNFLPFIPLAILLGALLGSNPSQPEPLVQELKETTTQYSGFEYASASVIRNTPLSKSSLVSKMQADGFTFYGSDVDDKGRVKYIFTNTSDVFQPVVIITFKNNSNIIYSLYKSWKYTNISFFNGKAQKMLEAGGRYVSIPGVAKAVRVSFGDVSMYVGRVTQDNTTYIMSFNNR